MNRIYCDICEKEFPSEDWREETLSYTDLLKEKGEGAVIVNVEYVVKGKSEDHYWTRNYDLCPECQKKIDQAVLALIGNG